MHCTFAGRGKALERIATPLCRIVATPVEDDADSHQEMSFVVLQTRHTDDTLRWESARSHPRPAAAAGRVLAMADVLAASASGRAQKGIHRIVMPLVQGVSYWRQLAFATKKPSGKNGSDSSVRGSFRILRRTPWSPNDRERKVDSDIPGKFLVAYTKFQRNECQSSPKSGRKDIQTSETSRYYGFDVDNLVPTEAISTGTGLLWLKIWR
jgi:hypothetical protein